MTKSGLRRILSENLGHASNLLSFVSTRLLAIGLFAISVPIFVNRTSEVEYGVVAIGFSLLGLSMVFDVGIGYVVTQSVGRKLARAKRSNPEVYNRLAWLYLLSTGVMAGLALVVLSVLDGLSSDERVFFAWLSLLLPCLAISGVVAAVFQAHNDLVYLNTSRFLFEIGKASSLIVSGLFFGSLSAVGPVLLVVAVVRAGVDLRSCKTRLGYELHRPNIAALRRSGGLVAFGMPALGSVMLTLAVTIGDKLLIVWWYAKEDVAHYSLAFDINTKAYLLINAINTTMFATMLRNYANGKNCRTQVNIGLAAVGVVSIMFYLPMAIFSQQVLSLWINPEVASASSPLATVMALACIVYLFGNVFENSLLADGRSRSVFLVYCLAVGSYFLSVTPLQRSLGVLGFVWAYFLLSTVLCAGMVVAHVSVPKLGRSVCRTADS